MRNIYEEKKKGKRISDIYWKETNRKLIALNVRMIYPLVLLAMVGYRLGKNIGN